MGQTPDVTPKLLKLHPKLPELINHNNLYVSLLTIKNPNEY